MHLDAFDRTILAELQENGHLTNQELAERVHLSASQCSRRRARLEREGYISGYRAVLDPAKLGFAFVVFVEVKLGDHSGDNADKFRRLVDATPAIQACYALTGDFDYLVKASVPGLPGLQSLINDILLPHPAISQVRSNIVLEELKSGDRLPIG
ncbi:MAG: Lrp/AsnC family transcriptional regulator [Hyphomicrobiales bacterium]